MSAKRAAGRIMRAHTLVMLADATARDARDCWRRKWGVDPMRESWYDEERERERFRVAYVRMERSMERRRK